MNISLDVLCVADICVDLVLTGNVRPRFRQVEQLIDDYAVELGGSGSIFATQFVKLGGKAGVIGRVGDDPFGRFVLGKLTSLGVDTGRVRTDGTVKTGIGVALAEPDDRAILTYVGTIDGVDPCDLTDDLLASCRHWHLASFFLLNRLRGYWKGWLEKCRRAGLTTSMDTNWDPQERWDGVLDILPLIDVFMPNEAEATSIAGEPDVRRAGRRLAACGPLVIIKCGSKGAVAFTGNEVTECPVPDEAKPVRVIDTTGAGDNFDAGFMRGWLLGKPLKDCLELGCRCGAASLTAAGGIQAQLVGEVGIGAKLRQKRGSLAPV
jgi:sugar/nucleoside kinase (ribokinase family)